MCSLEAFFVSTGPTFAFSVGGFHTRKCALFRCLLFVGLALRPAKASLVLVVAKALLY